MHDWDNRPRPPFPVPGEAAPRSAVLVNTTPRMAGARRAP